MRCARVWTEPGAAPYMASLAYLDAASPDAYAKALASWVSPSTNHVYADVAGTIAWFAAGAAPIGSGWDGLLPVPGNGRYEWRGFVPFRQCRSAEPGQGFRRHRQRDEPARYLELAGLAARLRMGGAFAHRRASTRCCAPSRATRSQDSLALQTDVLSLPARRLTDLLHALPADGDARPRARPAATLGPPARRRQRRRGAARGVVDAST